MKNLEELEDGPPHSKTHLNGNQQIQEHLSGQIRKGTESGLMCSDE